MRNVGSRYIAAHGAAVTKTRNEEARLREDFLIPNS